MDGVAKCSTLVKNKNSKASGVDNFSKAPKTIPSPQFRYCWADAYIPLNVLIEDANSMHLIGPHIDGHRNRTGREELRTWCCKDQEPAWHWNGHLRVQTHFSYSLAQDERSIMKGKTWRCTQQPCLTVSVCLAVFTIISSGITACTGSHRQGVW